MSNREVDLMVDKILDIERDALTKIRYAKANEGFDVSEKKIKSDVISSIVDMLELEGEDSED